MRQWIFLPPALCARSGDRYATDRKRQKEIEECLASYENYGDIEGYIRPSLHNLGSALYSTVGMEGIEEENVSINA